MTTVTEALARSEDALNYALQHQEIGDATEAAFIGIGYALLVIARQGVIPDGNR